MGRLELSSEFVFERRQMRPVISPPASVGINRSKNVPDVFVRRWPSRRAFGKNGQTTGDGKSVGVVVELRSVHGFGRPASQALVPFPVDGFHGNGVKWVE